MNYQGSIRGSNFSLSDIQTGSEAWTVGSEGSSLRSKVAGTWSWPLTFTSTPPCTFLILCLSTGSTLPFRCSYNLTFSCQNIDNCIESDALLHICLGNTVNSCLSGLISGRRCMTNRKTQIIQNIFWCIHRTSQMALHSFTQRTLF